MAMKQQDKEENTAFSRVVVPVVLGLTGLVLFVLVPYTTGYGDVRRGVLEMVSRFWRGEADWQHGMLVPPIVAFLIWHMRDRWKPLPVKGSWFGLVCVGFSLFLYWVGYKANVLYFAMISCHALFASSILWIFGWAYLRVLIFPVLFLTFAWPLFFLTDTLAFQLRLVMSGCSSFFLNLIGLENLRVGTSLVSASDPVAGLAQGERFALDVESPCSGLRSLFALMMVSALFGFFTLAEPWKRWLLFALSLPLAVLGNFIRLLVLVFGILLWGSDFAVGKDGGTSAYHFMAGIVVFVVALGGMAILAAAMRGKYGASRRRVRISSCGNGEGREEEEGTKATAEIV